MRKAQLTYASPNYPPWKRFLIQAVERASGRRQLETLYNEVLEDASPMAKKWAQALERLRVDVCLDCSHLARVPTDGPVVVIANHPFGVVDGLVLLDVLASLREDYCILVNAVLCNEPRLEPYLLPVDLKETPEALRTNVATRRDAMKRLRRGGALGIFPAGHVATAPGGCGRARESEWKRFVAKLVQVTRATVVPLYFEGQNSRVFQVASQFSRTIRLALLLHEVLNKRDRTIKVHSRDPLFPEELSGMRRTELMHHLWRVTHALGGE